MEREFFAKKRRLCGGKLVSLVEYIPVENIIKLQASRAAAFFVLERLFG